MCVDHRCADVMHREHPRIPRGPGRALGQLPVGLRKRQVIVLSVQVLEAIEEIEAEIVLLLELRIESYLGLQLQHCLPGRRQPADVHVCVRLHLRQRSIDGLSPNRVDSDGRQRGTRLLTRSGSP